MPYRPKQPKEYRDADWLRRKYVDERLSSSEIADICECHKSTILSWLDRHGIDTRSASEATRVEWEGDEERRDEFRENVQPLGVQASEGWRAESMPFGTDQNGYEKWKASGEEFQVHRLLAISEYGADAVAGNDVHHEIPIPWLNIPDNVVPKGHAEHTREHKPWEARRVQSM